MDLLIFLKEEHLKIRDYLDELDCFILKEDDFDFTKLTNLLEEFHNVWTEHEKREEKFVSELGENAEHFPVDKMLIEHKELKGHWKIINDALESKNEENLRICLDTDGKMLVEKIRKHAEMEDRFFEVLELKGAV